MHESGLVAALLRQVGETVSAAGAARAVTVEVWLGALSHLSPSHLEAHFTAAAAGTSAAGARLVVSGSNDIHHPDARHLKLLRVEVED